MNKYPELAKYFEESYGSLVKKVSRRAGTPENAEDVVQEAFFRACKYWSSYDPKTKLGSWFGTILNNACKDLVRENRMMGTTVELEDDQLDPVSIPDHEYRTDERIMNLIRSKKQPEQEVLRLYYEEGYKPIEIKEILDMRHGAVRDIIWLFGKEVKEKLEVAA